MARSERAFTLLELVVAITLLAMVAAGFAASVGLGFRTIALSRQRQTATQIANARLERLRQIPYADVALDPAPPVASGDQAPWHDTDPTHPNHRVSGDATTFDVTGSGPIETLIYAGAGEAAGVRHVEDPITVGSTVMEIYQYATWVDDPSITGTEDFKRVTVVVRYKAPSVNGVNKIISASALYTPGTVTWQTPTTVASATTTTLVSATTTTTSPSSTTTTTTSPLCAGDSTSPTGSFTLTGGAGAETGYTPVPQVTLGMSFNDSCTPILAQFNNDGGAYGSDIVYDASNPSASWTLESGDGEKTVGGRVRDGAGNLRTLSGQTIVLDTTAPTTPSGSLTQSVSCSGTNRTVVLSFGTSTDTNLRGYRVYRSTNGVTFSQLANVAASPASDTHLKTLESVQFYVVAYDKAGNESSPTNVVALTKNQCS